VQKALEREPGNTLCFFIFVGLRAETVAQEPTNNSDSLSAQQALSARLSFVHIGTRHLTSSLLHGDCHNFEAWRQARKVL